MKIGAVLAGGFSIAALVVTAAPAQAATEVFNFADNVDGIFAFGTLTTSDTPNTIGTFDITDITGTVIDARTAAPTVDQISGMIPNFSDPTPTDAFGFIYDNVMPLNINGVLFEGASADIYNLWSTGGTTGELYTYGDGGLPAFDAKGTLSVGVVPEPATWAIMLMGFAGLGGALRAVRRQHPVTA